MESQPFRVDFASIRQRVVSISPVLWSIRAILAFMVLVWNQSLQASEPCPMQQMRTVLIADADRKTGDVIIFRGEISRLPAKESMRLVHVVPMRYVDYAVDEVLWGRFENTSLRSPYQSSRPCGLPTLTMNASVFVLCWASLKSCGNPVPATDENSRKIRDLIRQARLRQRKVSVSPAQAEARVIHKVKPLYSEIAKLTRTQGDVVLQIVINARGRVIDARVLSGPSLLGYDAVSAVQQWRYHPFFLNGTPVRAETSVTFHFRL
jgi:TonB family protein